MRSGVKVAAGSGVSTFESLKLPVLVYRSTAGKAADYRRRAAAKPTRRNPHERARAGTPDFAPGRGGFLQLLGMSLSPCCRFHPAEVKEPPRSVFGSPMQPSPSG